MIGTLRETSLHAALKQWYARPGDELEIQVDGYVVDIRRGRGFHIPGTRRLPPRRSEGGLPPRRSEGGLPPRRSEGGGAPRWRAQRGQTLVEIQTRHFSAIRRKLLALVEHHPVRLLHPIAFEKVIVRLPRPGAAPLSRRRSPKHGQLALLFLELVSIPDLIGHPNFSLEVLLTREEEILCPGRGGSWRRRGWRVHDRRLVEVVAQVAFESADDFKRFLPASLPQPFTSRDVADASALPLYLAQKMTYCMRRMGLIAPSGKRRAAIEYTIAPGRVA